MDNPLHLHILYRILGLFVSYGFAALWIFMMNKSEGKKTPSNPGLGGYDGGHTGIIVVYVYALIFIVICWFLYILYEAYKFHTTGNFDLRNINLLMAGSVIVLSYLGLKITVGI